MHTTWDGMLTAIQGINDYLDDCKAKGDKERLAYDLETYLTTVSRARYDYAYTLKCLTPARRAKVLSGEHKIPGDYDLRQADKYPVPRAHKNKYGEFDARIRLMQLGINPAHINLQNIFDLDLIFQDRYQYPIGLATEEKVFEFYSEVGLAFKSLFLRSGLTIIGQNLKYEYQFTWMYLKLRLGTRRDVGLMNQVLHMGDKIDGKLSHIYEKTVDPEVFESIAGITFEEYHKFKAEEQTSPWWQHPLTDKQYLYSAHDVLIIFFSFDSLLSSLIAWDEIYNGGHEDKGPVEVAILENDLTAAIAKAEMIGFPIDKDYYFTELKPQLEKDVEEAQAEADKLWMRKVVKEKKKTIGSKKNRIIQHYTETTYEPYNLNSPDQVREILGEDLCKQLPLTDKGAPSTGAKNLFFLKDQHPVVALVLKLKKAKKKMGFFESEERGYFAYTNSDNMINHGIYQIGTDENTVATGRMAGARPNLMNVIAQASIRKGFGNKKGYKLVVLDYSQIQLWIAAWLCQDTFLTTCFLTNKDLHSETAKIVFELDFLPDKNDPEQNEWRKKGKTMRFAKTFQMGLEKFLRTTYVDTDGAIDYIMRGEEGIEEARKVIARLDNTTPEVCTYRDQVEASVKASARSFGTLSNKSLRKGKPYYVSISPTLRRTRRFSLDPIDKALAAKNPEDFHPDKKVLYERTGNISTWANKFNSIVRDTAREAFNNEIQSPEADIVKIAIVEINKRLEELADQGIIDEYSEGFVLPVHDELILLAKDENAQLLHDIAKEEMSKAAARFNKTIPMKVDSHIVDTWNQAK